MKTTDIIRRAGRNLRQAKLRTLLTSLAISVGAFTITLALAASTGAKLYTDSLIESNGDKNSISVFAAQEEQASSGPQKIGDSGETSTIYLKQSDIDTIKNIDGVATVTPMYDVNASYVTGPNNEKYGAPLTIKADATELALKAGSLDNNQPSKGKVVLSESYVKPLGFASANEAIGQTITLRIDKPALPGTTPEGKELRLEVQAVDGESQMALRYTEGIKISAADGQEIYDYQRPDGDPRYYGATVEVTNENDAELVKQRLEDANYQAMTLADVQEILFTFVNVVMGGVAGFGALAILASVFGIINTQYISVLERTQQIGLMKALGARRRDIGRLFRYEAAWVGFLGGLIGTLAAFAMSGFNPMIAEALNLEEGTKLLVFELLPSVILIISLMLIAILAGYFPSRKAAKLDPIEALRTE